jgi:DNA-directed RNA polymerase specialized sigma24 family protein
MPREYVRQVALFFFFALLDESIAQQSAERAIAQLKIKLKDTYFDQAERDTQMSRYIREQVLRACQSGWQKDKELVDPKAPVLAPRQLQISENALAAWMAFHKDANEDELIALIFTKILGFPEDQVAEVCHVSIGTLRHRLSRGVRQLGAQYKQRAS